MENVSLFRSCNLQLNSPTVNAQFLRIGFPRPKHWDCGRIDLRPAVAVLISLPKWSYNPLQIKLENWHSIQKYTSVNAFVVDNYIFTTLKFPIIALQNNKDRENNHYTLLRENELNECIRDIITYTCEKNFPIYHIQSDASCEVQIFANMSGQLRNCEYERIRPFLASTTLWIMLTEDRMWLYSVDNYGIRRFLWAQFSGAVQEQDETHHVKGAWLVIGSNYVRVESLAPM
ncbi:hypothetical protein ALC53_10530 [Atta colombica]|uniref:Uncharacterized protein n=1 Tax=Atta colombica TaxID=520822 RepID=A0A195B3B1_9HYME|nr:hypothetical protein ALC53_10530 [Atta colombica]